MTVYVDDMFKHALGKFRRMKMSHLMADTDHELHAMADKIGVVRRWHQDKERWADSHYDIAMSKRALAVAAGAVEITLREMAAYAWHRRVHRCVCVPSDALKKMEAALKERIAGIPGAQP
jgi:hypothetical protein